jgi:outer membrane protein insertion porin family
MGSAGHRHELGYSAFWRQITGLAENASPSVRGDAGDSVKSSVSYSWVNDQRDNPVVPSRGYYARIFNEIAGFGLLQGDVSFWKSEFETQGALPINLPILKGPSGISLTTSFRGGILLPLGSDSDRRPQMSRINDRFQLGGPGDVRGFRLSGLGPHEGPDALGGDVYAAGSINLLAPLPRLGADNPFRLQAFVNAGRLVALQTPQGESPKTHGEARDSLAASISELKNGLPSAAAGIGLVYAHPAARLELNFSLPLVLRRGEEGRKGLQLGIGINLM